MWFSGTRRVGVRILEGADRQESLLDSTIVPQPGKWDYYRYCRYVDITCLTPDAAI